MSRTPSNIMSSRQRHGIEKRKAARLAPPGPYVSYDALLGIVDRECEKRGRRWYGVDTAMQVVREIQEADPETRALARKMMLDRLDAFPLRVAS